MELFYCTENKREEKNAAIKTIQATSSAWWKCQKKDGKTCSSIFTCGEVILVVAVLL